MNKMKIVDEKMLEYAKEIDRYCSQHICNQDSCKDSCVFYTDEHFCCLNIPMRWNLYSAEKKIKELNS